MSGPRVGLIGARRARQGLGPFVARDLVAAGAAVTCFLGTRAETVEAARRELRETVGIEARGYTRLEDMLAREALDALAILSPAATHEAYLRAATQAELHTLCEKPLLWGGTDLLDRTRARIEGFRTRGLLLCENCQWPYTLDAFRLLHPAVLDVAPRRFAMRLSPGSSGLALLGDCLPHPLSLLQALAPAADPRVENPRYELFTADRANLGVGFDYVAGGNRVRVKLELRQGREVPRAASLEIDGHRAERRIKLPEYSMEFTDGERRVKVPDPLSARIQAFVAQLEEVRGGAKLADPSPILSRMAMLESLLHAYREQVGDRGC